MARRPWRKRSPPSEPVSYQRRGPLNIRLVANHWGWSPKKVLFWIKAGWALPFAKWRIENTTRGNMIEHRCKIGPVAWTSGWSQPS